MKRALPQTIMSPWLVYGFRVLSLAALMMTTASTAYGQTLEAATISKDDLHSSDDDGAPILGTVLERHATLELGPLALQPVLGYDEDGVSATIDALDESLAKAGINYRIEWYPGVEHGFAFPKRAGIYDKPAAERHWERLFALFARNL